MNSLTFLVLVNPRLCVLHNRSEGLYQALALLFSAPHSGWEACHWATTQCLGEGYPGREWARKKTHHALDLDFRVVRAYI